MKKNSGRQVNNKEVARAQRFAHFYTNLVEALMARGCAEDVAREEARMTAFSDLQIADEEARVYDPALGPCPTCGNG